MSNITPKQARAELARRELARRKGNMEFNEEQKSALRKAGAKATTIGAPQLKDKILGPLPSIGQFAGGALGAGVGAMVGHPVAGVIAGGTAGRAIARIGQQQQKAIEKDPGKALLNILMHGPLVGGVKNIPAPARKKLGQEIMKTAAIETIGAGIGRAVTSSGKGALEALLGKRVAQRGFEVGFKKLLDPKFYKNRIDKLTATKIGKFFDRLINVTGKNVEKAMKARSSTFVGVDDILAQGKKALVKGGANTVDDFSSPMVSRAQLNRAKAVQDIFDSIGTEDKISVYELWKKRQEMDKIIFGTRWNPDLENYLFDLRSAFNNTIKSSGDDVVKAFGRYEFVRNQEKKMGKDLAVEIFEGETYAEAPEGFANRVLSPRKDELVRKLKALDNLLENPEDKIVDDLLDIAAAETLERDVELMGLVQRGLLGSIGGRRAIAGGAAMTQTPPAQILHRLLGRGIPTATTEVLPPYFLEGQM